MNASPTTHGIAWRPSGRHALTGVLGLLALVLLAPPLLALSPDTVQVYPPTRFTNESTNPNTWMFCEDGFTADTLAGWRYVVEVVQGSPALSKLNLSVGAQQYVGSSDFGTYVTRLLRAVDVGAGGNGLALGLKGSYGAWIDVRVVRVKDPTYTVFGRKEYVKSASSDSAVTDTFRIPADAAAVHTLHLYNGTPGGASRLTTGYVNLNGVNVVGNNDLGTGHATATHDVGLLPHDALNTVKVVNTSAVGTRATLWFTVTDNTPPEILLAAPFDTADTLYTTANSVTVSGTVRDSIAGLLDVDHHRFLTPGPFSLTMSLPVDGRYLDTLYAVNAARRDTTVYRTVFRDTQPPTVTLTSPATDTTVVADSLLLVGSWIDLTRTAVTIDGEVIGNASSGAISIKYALDLGPNRVWLRGVDALGNKTDLMRIVFRATPNEPAPPAVSAPSLSSTGITSFAQQAEFLYTGTAPVDSGVNAGSLDPLLVAVIRGRVIGRDYGPLANVYVRVLDHPEYGLTKSRADGQFDLVVNGGGVLTLRFTKSGYLEVQRPVEVLPNDYNILEDVALIGKTAKRTVVDMNAALPAVVRSRFASDANGDRDVRLFIPPQTTLRVARPGLPGDSADFSAARIRATEFTIGPDGQRAMPAILPPSSAYTYCVELTTDEADSMAAAGQPSPWARLTRPVATYVKGFLPIPVGSSVPVGYYDRDQAKWIPTTDGVVVKIVGASGDTALIDSDNDSLPDAQSRLESLGVTSSELLQLKSQYSVGDTLWRVAVNHFTIFDFNYNLGMLLRDIAKAFGRFSQWLKLLPDPCHATGSIIECENRVLGEQIPIVGSSLSLNYRSYRAPGDSAIRTVRVPVLDTIPEGLTRIIVHLDIAGQRLSRVFNRPFSENTVVSLPWNGLDAYGRRVEGSARARLSIGYQYGVTYAVGSGGSSLGDPNASGAVVADATGDRSVGRTTWTRSSISVGAPSTGADGLGGWTLSAHHVYDPNGQGAVYFGDGSVELGERLRPVRTAYAGNGITSPLNNNVPATKTAVGCVALALGLDGALYLADNYRGAVLRVSLSDTLTLIAGSHLAPYSGDAPVATSVTMRNLTGLAVSPDGSIYVTMNAYDGRLCRVTPGGGIQTIAGGIAGATHTGGGDGGPARQATLFEAYAPALGPDGSLFLVEYFGTADIRIRRIAPNGIITTYAGGGTATGDTPTKATNVKLGGSPPYGLAVDGDGNLYFTESDHHCVRRIAPDGTLTTFAVGGADFKPQDIAFAPDGSLYIASSLGPNAPAANRIWRRDPDGTLSIIAGGGTLLADGSPAGVVKFTGPTSIAVTADGSYFVGDPWARSVYRIGSSLPSRTAGEFKVPSPDGSEVYFFDRAGRHLRTRDALTGAVHYRFGYDGAGRLATVYDWNNDTTRIERAADGRPLAIVAPYNRRTSLTLDASGHLETVTNPANDTYQLSTRPDGLLDSFRDPNLHQSTLTWDGEGRLEEDYDPAGGYQRLVKDESGITRTITRTTGEHRTTTYTVTDHYNGTLERTVVGPDNLLSSTSDGTDAVLRTVLPAGVQITDTLGPAPRFFMMSPLTLGRREVLGTGGSQIQRWVRHGQTVSPSFDPPFVPGTWQDSVSVNGRPFWATTEFNSQSLLLTSRSAAHRVFATAVDTAGRPLSLAAAGLTPVMLSYNARGLLEGLSQGARGWSYGHDDLGRLHTIRDALDHVTTFDYDDADRLTEATLPGSRAVQFGYDARGNLTSLTPPGRTAHSFDYTAVDLTERYRPPAAGLTAYLTRYRYNLDRQLTRIERPDSTNLTLNYEATPNSGRLKSISLPRGTITLYYHPTTGMVDSLSSPDRVTVSYGYNGPLVTSEAWSGKITGSVGHTYDGDFRVATQSVNGGQTISFGYDLDGLLTSAGALSLTRNLDNGLITGTTIGSVITTEMPNGFGELGHYTAVAGGTTLYDASYTRDELGRVRQVDEALLGNSITKVYTYSDTGFLATVTETGRGTERYGYDGNGNRLWFESAGDTASGTYDAQDRPVRYGDTTYTWTHAGELSAKFFGTDTTRYTYDPLGNLLAVVLPNGDRIDYLIDGANRRVGRKVNGRLVKGWLYQNGLNVVAELDSVGNVVSRFVYGTRGHVPDYLVKGGATYRLISDHLGSVRLVVDAVADTVSQQLDYDAWGRVRLDTNPGFQPFGYAGGLWDRATGLVRFGARDYDASVGRWTIKDPIGFGGGTANLYGYVGNTPVTGVDPLGLIDSEALEYRYNRFPDPTEGLPLYGNWTGPGWRNRTNASELGDYPYLPGHRGYIPPIGPLDECSREHDVNLRKCAQIPGPSERQRCRKEADLDFASCLTNLPGVARYATAPFQLWFWCLGPNGRSPGRNVP